MIENPGLAGQVVTVSVEDPTATLAVDLSGASGTIAAGSGRRSVTLTVPSGATGNVTLTLSGTAVSFAKPMLTRGTVAPLFERLPQTFLIQLCQRYYEKSYDLGTAPGAASVTGLKVSRATVTSSNAAVDGLATSFAVRKRATASTTWYSPTGVAARVRDQVTSTDLVVTATTIPSEWGTGAPNVTGPTAGNLVYAHWVAEAEL